MEEQSVDFREGFTVITGETGAGKSVFLSGLKLISGEKASQQLIRTGCNLASAEAVFSLDKLPEVRAFLEKEEIGEEHPEDLIIQREILSSGKSRARINGTLVSVSLLQNISRFLLQLHGQSEQLILKDNRTQLRQTDLLAGNQELLSTYKNLWQQWQKLLARENELKEKARILAQQQDFLQHQFDELEKAGLQQNEETELEEKLASVDGSGQKAEMLAELISLLDANGGQGLQGAVKQAASLMEDLSDFPQISALAESVRQAAYQFEEVRDIAVETASRIHFDADELDKINGRISQIQRLKRKYRTDFAGLLELKAQRAEELSTLNNAEIDITDIRNLCAEVHQKLKETADTLHKKRQTAATALEKEMKKHLAELDMGKAVFHVQLQETELTPQGSDHCEFLLSPNPGETPRPLRKAISGGELSRLMLALKNILAAKDAMPLLVFDEVDSGISGEVGHKVGEALKQLSSFHQVLTITHLHQVASRADNHLAVVKEVHNNRTFSRIDQLNKEERIQEMSRMMGGTHSPEATELARSILEKVYD